MPPYVQTNRRLSVTTPLKGDPLLLNGFTGNESISRLFHFQLQCIAEHAKNVPFDELLGQPVTVEVALPDKSKRYINGICNRVAQGGRDKVFTQYLLDIVPKFWLLSRKTQSKIYQHISVPDILKKVLATLDVSWEIPGRWEPRNFCVQYRESDYAFASRLMEEEGIFYFFKHDKGSHKMVVANDKARHPGLTPKSLLTFESVRGGTRPDDRITSWEKAQELRSGKVTLWDHSFQLVHHHLQTEAHILGGVRAGKSSHKLALANNAELELYDYPGAYAHRFDGISKSGGDQFVELRKIFIDNERTAGIRMQEEAAASVLVQGSSNVRHLVSGHKFTLSGHFEGDGTPWVLYQIEHVASEAADVRSGRGGFKYQNHFTCFPFDLPFRPPRLTARPVVYGTQTADVVGPPGEDVFTDYHGRVKVQFRWDREGKGDTDSSCWIRVGQPSAGCRWGASFWPRIGQEVVVDFLEGDPDQPIIVGSVYNVEQVPPYLGSSNDPKHKNDNKLMGVKSNTTLGGQGFNEWRFDDTKGKQQIFLHAERNMDTRVKNDSMESVGGSKHLTVGGEKDGKIWGDYKQLVYHDVFLHNKRHLLQHVGDTMWLIVGGESEDPGDLEVTVKGDRGTLVGQNDHVHVKGVRKEKVDGDQSLTVGGDQQEKVGTKHALEAGQEIHLKSGMKVVIEAGMQLTLKGPGGFIDINSGGIFINGSMVYINSGGEPGSGSGSSPASPEDAHEAGPHDPTPADDAKTGYPSSGWDPSSDDWKKE